MTRRTDLEPRPIDWVICIIGVLCAITVFAAATVVLGSGYQIPASTTTTTTASTVITTIVASPPTVPYVVCTTADGTFRTSPQIASRDHLNCKGTP